MRVFNLKISLYLVVIFLIAAINATAFFIFRFQKPIYDYKLFLPENGEKSAVEFQYGVWPALSNPDFFNNTLNKFISGKATFIEADLSNMQLRFYKNGELQKDFPILSKGKEGSWWETPTGLYKISLKQKNHFSSFGQVYQPYSMIFQGNFFIHGWPYYENGSPVGSTYSGGCIRLSTNDAEELFNLTNTGIPVLVYENKLKNDSFKYQSKIPEISAKNYLAVDLKNNFVFLEKNGNEKVSIASLTKLVTAMIAAEYVNLDKEIFINKSMIISTSEPRLFEGQSISAYQLLFPLLMESSNEAATAFSKFLGEEYFIFLMNNKVKSLGMNNTAFVDSSGIGEGNISTAEDIFELVKNLYNNRSFILKISAGKIKDSVYGVPEFKNLENFNVFEDDPEFLGGKVGETKAAKQTIVALFNINFSGETRPIAIIALGSENRAKDAQLMKDYIKLNFK